MNIVIELDTDILIEKSKALWADISKVPLDSYNGVSVLEDYRQEEINIPWLSGKVGCIIFEPNSKCPIHCDDHENVAYSRSLNILVESDGNNHSTRYYTWKHGEWNPKERQALFDQDINDLTMVHEFTVTKPTIFYNQMLHDVFNSGNKQRVMIMWLIDKTVSDEDIFNWCNDNNISYKVTYEV